MSVTYFLAMTAIAVVVVGCFIRFLWGVVADALWPTPIIWPRWTYEDIERDMLALREEQEQKKRELPL